MFPRTPLQSLIGCGLQRWNSVLRSRSLTTDTPPLTTEQFPQMQRGSYARLTAADLDVFQGILSSNQVVTDPENLQGANTDWMKMYRGFSAILLRPRSTSEVSSILKYCNDKGLAVCPQGGNTGLVGGSVPVFDEIILSTSLMNKILDLDTTAGVLQCEAGSVLQQLEEYVNERGLMIPLDLGAKGSCQIGGNVSTNAGGVRVLRYGSLHGSVLGLEVVLANGEVLDLMSCLKKDNTGYDLKQLFIGAEGTLGVVTKVAIQCPPKPKSLSVAFLSCTSFDEVLSTFRLAKRMLSEVLSSFEMMDSESVEPLDRFYNIRLPITPNNFYVLIEVTGSNEEHDQAKLNSFLEKVMEEGHVKDGTVASSLSAVKALWSIREQVTPVLHLQGFVHKHDLSLPLHLYYKVVEATREHLRNISSVRCVGFGHLGDSNVHLNVIVQDPAQKTAVEESLYPFLYDWVARKGGSISAEHGVGLKKRDVFARLKSPTALDAMRRIKKTLDPSAILNPYKVL